MKQAQKPGLGLRLDQFSAALCRGLIEAGSEAGWPALNRGCFPRLYAAASLKRQTRKGARRGKMRFPRLYAAASLKQIGMQPEALGQIEVFRGFMPRPH